MSPSGRTRSGRPASSRGPAWLARAAGLLLILAVLWARTESSPHASSGRDGLLVVTVEGLAADELEALFAPLAGLGVTLEDVRVASTDPLDGLVSLWTGLHPSAHAARTRGVPIHALWPAEPDRRGSLVAVPESLPPALVEGLGFPLARSPDGTPVDVLPPDGAAEQLASLLAQDVRNAGLDLADLVLWGHLDLTDARPDAVREALVEAVEAHRAVAPDGAVLLVGVGRRSDGDTTPGGPEGWLAEDRTRQRALLIPPAGRPGSDRAGARVSRTVGTVDLTATLAELRGPDPAGLQGRPLVRDLAGRTAWAGPVWVETPPESGGWTALHWGPDRLVASRGAPGEVRLERLGPGGWGPDRAEQELELAVHLSEAMLALDAENRARAAGAAPQPR